MIKNIPNMIKNIRGTPVTSRISAPTEKAEEIQILDYGEIDS